MLVYVMKEHCGTCKYFEWDGQENKKGYCAWYKAYYYPDDECDHWEDNGKPEYHY